MEHSLRYRTSAAVAMLLLLLGSLCGVFGFAWARFRLSVLERINESAPPVDRLPYLPSPIERSHWMWMAMLVVAFSVSAHRVWKRTAPQRSYSETKVPWIVREAYVLFAGCNGLLLVGIFVCAILRPL